MVEIKKNQNFQRTIILLGFSIVTILGCLNIEAQSLTDIQISDKCASSVAIVLVGDGEGVVKKIASAVSLKSEGVLLVPYHVVKDAKEVQVRLKSGEIFDDVSLLGIDERRDVAAIKIRSADLTTTTGVSIDDLKVGDTLYLFTHYPGKLWSMQVGKLMGVKLADEVPGAGEGFRVIQFDGSLPEMDGGVISNSNGVPVGIVTKEYSSPRNSGFAVPISNVKGLADLERSRTFPSGSALKLPQSEAVFRASKLPDTPLSLLEKSETIYVETNTTFFKEQQLINELNKRKEVKEWGWVLTTGSYEARNKADIIIELDHQILTFNFTFTVRHRRSSILLSAGKVTIADGASGAPKMVDNIIKSISVIKNPPPSKVK
ncbi:MAG: trypsin-like peptidase domain-containing protein [Pyrinomonadaceae bacterium]